MAAIADTDPSYNSILLDREKYFKGDYENLPIADLDKNYFDSQNSIDLMGSFLFSQTIRIILYRF